MRLQKRASVWVIVGLGALGYFTGCQKTANRGVTETEIIIGQWGPQTGPAALWGAVARGTACYFRMINAQGGINGRQIRYVFRDDAYQPARTKAVVKEMLENDGVFAFVGGVGTSPGMAVKAYLEENSVPWVSPASGSTHWAFPPTHNLFSTYPLYSDEAAVLADYAMTQLHKTKIAVLYQNDDYGKAGLVGAEMALEKQGLQLVEKASMQIMDTDLGSHILRLKNAGAEVVIMYLLPKQAAISLGTAAKLGFKPQWMTSSTLSDATLMYNITQGLWKDVIFAGFAELPDSPLPLMQQYREAREKFAPDEQWSTFFHAGFFFAEPLVEALKRCGKTVTTEKLINALESLHKFQGTGPAISFGPGQRQGTRSIFLAKSIDASHSEKISDWLTAEIDIQEAIQRLQEGD